MIEYKRVSTLAAQDQGRFTARVAVTGNVDRYGDRIVPGAFTATLATWAARSPAKIPVVYAHAWDRTDALLGEVVAAQETAAGLEVEAQLDLETAEAANVYRRMKAGGLSEFSFGFETVSARTVLEDGAEVRELLAVDLFEVGPCLVGVNPETRLLGVKGAGRIGLAQVAPLAEALRLVLETGAPLSDLDRKALAALRPVLLGGAAPPDPPPVPPGPVDPAWLDRLGALMPPR